MRNIKETKGEDFSSNTTDTAVMPEMGYRVANPDFVKVVEGAYHNKNLHNLFESLTHKKLPKDISFDGNINDESHEDMMVFIRIVKDLVWDSAYPGTPIEYKIN